MGFKRRSSGPKKSRRIFKNDDIKAFNIDVTDENGEKLGTMPRAKALWLAGDKGLDLVQTNYDPVTKICSAKIVDFGKFQYENKKAEADKRKKQKAKLQKEVKFGYRIWDHDLELKVKKGIEFLSKWHPLKVSVVLKGREKMYKDIVRIKLDWVEEKLKEFGKTQGIKNESHWYTLLVMPTKQWQAKKKSQKNEKPKKVEKKDIKDKEKKSETWELKTATKKVEEKKSKEKSTSE